MDIQFWLYIIIAVIYVLSRALKKPESNAGNPPPPERPGNSNPFPSREKPLSFEELLKQITEANEPRKTVYQPQESQVIDYDDDLQEEQRSLETVTDDYRKTDNVYQVYEDAKSQAFLRPSLEDTLKVTDTDMRFGKFKEFQQVNQRNLLEDYTKEFRDPEGLKKAVVMAEILNRKF
jgi:hypothetical protein